MGTGVPRRSILAVLGLLAWIACTPHADLLVEHQKAEARWQEQRSADYRFLFKRVCECPEEYLREVWISVSGEATVDVTFADDQSQVPRELWADFPTVDGMFGKIRGAAQAHADEIRVDYDPDAGYPLSIFIDLDENMADEETIWYARDLQRLAGD